MHSYEAVFREDEVSRIKIAHKEPPKDHRRYFDKATCRSRHELIGMGCLSRKFFRMVKKENKTMKSISSFSRKINRKRCQLGDPSAGVGFVKRYSQFPSTFSLKMSCFQNDFSRQQ